MLPERLMHGVALEEAVSKKKENIAVLMQNLLYSQIR
jgi:hypothetical protein